MSFSPGDRVILTHVYSGLPAGSLGTVVHGTAVTTIVDFDALPSQSVLVPNTWLHSAAVHKVGNPELIYATSRGEKGRSEGVFAGSDGDLRWFEPTVVAPGVGTASSFVAVTAVPNLLTLLLQGAEVALRGETTSGCWIGSAEFPVVGGPAKLRVDARGFAAQTRGAKTTILIVIGAVFKAISFDDERDGDFQDSFDATIGGEPRQTITIILLAERTSASRDLLLIIDSLDIVSERM